MDTKKVLAFYVDIRSSTQIRNIKEKWDSYNKFYKYFKSLKGADGGYQIDRVYPSGDGILLISNCKNLEVKKLNDIFMEIQKKIDAFHKNTNLKLGAGASYGNAMDLQVESMNGGTEAEVIGTPLDLAAKSSDHGNKNSNCIWFISNNKRVRELTDQFNDELIEALKECDNLVDQKESNAGNFRFNFNSR